MQVELTASLLDARKEIEKKQEKIADIKMLDAVTDKGRNPPCWFRVVDDKSKTGSKRQRGVKIFDIKIEDAALWL